MVAKTPYPLLISMRVVEFLEYRDVLIDLLEKQDQKRKR